MGSSEHKPVKIKLDNKTASGMYILISRDEIKYTKENENKHPIDRGVFSFLLSGRRINETMLMEYSLISYKKTEQYPYGSFPNASDDKIQQIMDMMKLELLNQ